MAKGNYSRICEVLDFESEDSNFTVNFKTLSKRYGKEYMEYCQVAWVANETFTEEEFIAMNGNPPKGYFDKVIKNGKYEAKVSEL